MEKLGITEKVLKEQLLRIEVGSVQYEKTKNVEWALTVKKSKEKIIDMFHKLKEDE